MRFPCIANSSIALVAFLPRKKYPANKRRWRKTKISNPGQYCVVKGVFVEDCHVDALVQDDPVLT